MQSARQSPPVWRRLLVRRLLTLGLLLLAATSALYLATISPAASQTTTTEPPTTTTTAPTTTTLPPTTTTTGPPCMSPQTEEAWAACRTAHDMENLRADVLFGLVILIALVAAIFVSKLLIGSS